MKVPWPGGQPGVFPARAGMIPTTRSRPSSSMGIPRESGDDPKLFDELRNAGVYSPRERG